MSLRKFLESFPDTNVLMSAFIIRGLSAEIFRIIINEHDLIIGDVVLNEHVKILLNKIGIPPETVENIVDFLKSFELIRYEATNSPLALRDKDDEKILIMALESKSDVLVTGDRDLLDVKDNISIKVLTPREFLQLVKSG